MISSGTSSTLCYLQPGLDWPVGIAFRVHLTAASAEHFQTVPDVMAWFEYSSRSDA